MRVHMYYCWYKADPASERLPKVPVNFRSLGNCDYYDTHIFELAWSATALLSLRIIINVPSYAFTDLNQKIEKYCGRSDIIYSQFLKLCQKCFSPLTVGIMLA